MNFLILSSSGKDIGAGHLTRCTAIQEELLKLGHSVIHYTDSSLFSSKGVDYCNWTNYSLAELGSGSDIIIIDSYKTTNEWLSACTLDNTLIVHIDDYYRIPYNVDVVFNSNVFFKEIDYSGLSCSVFGGANYLIVRKEFRHTKKVYAKKSNTVLVTLGGGDHEKLFHEIAEWCISLPSIYVRVIAPFGMDFNNPRVVLLPALTAEKMAEEMNRAAVVISGSGQTLHELACLGRPTIGICLDYDQEPNHKFYNSIGFLQGNLFANQKNLKTALLDQLHKKLKEDSSQSVLLNLINPNGVENVIAQVIRSFYEIKR